MRAIRPRHVPAFLAALVAVLVICFNAGFLLSIRGPITTPVIEYKDFISILLTGVTIILGAVALGIAALAIWGYKALMEATTDQAERVATNHLEAYVTDARLRAVVEPLLAPLVAELAAKQVQPESAKAGGEQADADLNIPELPAQP